MAEKDCQIVVNDVFDELKVENNRLFNELIFADKCLKVLIEFKTFVELNSNQFKQNLDQNNKQIYEQMRENVNQVLEEKFNYSINFNDNILVEVKREVFSFDDNQRVEKTSKKSRKNKSNETKKNSVCDRPECQFSTYTESELQNHMRGHDNEVNDNPMNSFTNTNPMFRETNEMICQYCNKCFEDENNFNLHLISHFKNNDTVSNQPFIDVNIKKNVSKNKQYICKKPNCGQRFVDKEDLRQHRPIHYKKKTKEKTFICDVPGCKAAFERSSRLESHKILRHTEERPFECQTCGKTFATDILLNSHIKNLHNLFDEPVVCGIDDCTKRFKNEIGLRSHQRACHLLRFVCDHPNCDYKTGVKEQLKKHNLLNHTEALPLIKCQYEGCDKTFKLQEYYKYHLKSHSTTLLTCPYEGCGRTYYIDISLKKHIKIVHSDNWYSCEWPGCDYKTKRKGGLRCHMATHGDEHIACVWPKCDKMFKTNANMKSHLLTHKQEKNQICPLPGCDYRCITAGNLKLHMKNRHKDI